MTNNQQLTTYDSQLMVYDLIVIGSGAAGLSAAIYAGRYKLKTLLITGEFGGETYTAGKIENYPGFKSIDGYELMDAMKEQAVAIGTEINEGWAEKIEGNDECFIVSTKKERFHTHTLILAIGSKRRHLGLPKEKELTSKGVHYCWTCDGPLFGGKTVAMVGGGDSSVKGINFLAEYAKKIYLITVEKEPHAEPINMERMQKWGDKIEILAETKVTELVGTQRLERLKLSKPYQESDELVIDGMFIEIGFDPDKTFAQQLGLDLDEKGYIKVDTMMKTNVPGVFVAGDATNHFGRFKQDITAAALGAVAATSAYEYRQVHGETCPWHEKPAP